MHPVRRQTSPHAARLRRDRTDAEDEFWQAVRNRQLGGFKFRFQHSIAPYVADFAWLEAMPIVEKDQEEDPHQCRVNSAPRCSGHAGGMTDPTLLSREGGRGLGTKPALSSSVAEYG